MHELIAEFCRAREFKPEFLRRCQRIFHDEVQAQLLERQQLLDENAALKLELQTLRGQVAAKRGKTEAA